MNTFLIDSSNLTKLRKFCMNILINKFTDRETCPITDAKFVLTPSETALSRHSDILKLWQKQQTEKFCEVEISYGALQRLETESSPIVDLVLHEMECVNLESNSSMISGEAFSDPTLSVITPDQVPVLAEQVFGDKYSVQKHSWKGFECAYFTGSERMEKFVHIPSVQLELDLL